MGRLIPRRRKYTTHPCISDEASFNDKESKLDLTQEKTQAPPSPGISWRGRRLPVLRISKRWPLETKFPRQNLLYQPSNAGHPDDPTSRPTLRGTPRTPPPLGGNGHLHCLRHRGTPHKYHPRQASKPQCRWTQTNAAPYTSYRHRNNYLERPIHTRKRQSNPIPFTCLWIGWLILFRGRGCKFFHEGCTTG